MAKQLSTLIFSLSVLTSCQSVYKTLTFQNVKSVATRSVSSAADASPGDLSESPLEGDELNPESYPRYVVNDGNGDGWWGCFPATPEGQLLRTPNGNPLNYTLCVKKYISLDGNGDGKYSCFPATEDGKLIATPNLQPVSYKKCLHKYEAHDGADSDDIYTCYAKDKDNNFLATPDGASVYYSNCFGKYVSRDGNNDGAYSCFPATEEGHLLSGTAVHFSHCQ